MSVTFEAEMYISDCYSSPSSVFVNIVYRQAFELAKAAPGPIFGSRGEFDVEKIKQSKHFHFHLSQSNGKGVKEMVMLSLLDEFGDAAMFPVLASFLSLSLYMHCYDLLNEITY